MILQVMAPVIFISLLGFVYARFRKAEPQVLSDIIIYLTIPALFFISFYNNQLLFSELPAVFITIGAVMGGILLALLLLRKFFRLPVGLFLPAIFMNSAFVGFPVILLAYGPEGLTRAIAYDFINGLVIFTLGVFVVSRRKDFTELFRLPFLYAALLGLAFNYFGLRLPDLALRSIEMLGSITIPLALLMLGFRLGLTKIKTFTLPVVSSILRMGLGTAIAVFCVWALRVDPLLGRVLIVMSALPSAFMGLVLAEKYKTDEELVASSIAVCTLLAVIYLPFLLWILS
ncbi:AEC family transporter [Candidatus Saganbacteria bacterium]|nr:AEC family transporter [Candidatus Saganbacteria bacterium]